MKQTTRRLERWGQVILWIMLLLIIAAILGVQRAAAQTVTPTETLIAQPILVTLGTTTPLPDVTLTFIREDQPVVSGVTGADGVVVVPIAEGSARLLLAGTLPDGTPIQWNTVYRERGQTLYITSDPGGFHVIVGAQGTAELSVVLIGDSRLGPGSNPTANPPTPTVVQTLTPIPLAATVIVAPTAVATAPAVSLPDPARPTQLPTQPVTPTPLIAGGGVVPPAQADGEMVPAQTAPQPWVWIVLGIGLGLTLAVGVVVWQRRAGRIA